MTVPVDHLIPGPVAAAYFNEELENTPATDLVVVAPHEGQVPRTSDFRKRLIKLKGENVDMAFVSKTRNVKSLKNLDPSHPSYYSTLSNTKHTLAGKNAGDEYTPTLVGDVKGKTCVIVDDIVDTGTTLINAVKLLKAAGAHKVYAYATHALFTKDSTLREITDSELEYLLVTNTVYHKRGTLPGKVRQLSVAPLVAEAIARTIHNQSVSGILKDKDEGEAEEKKADPRFPNLG